MKNKIRNYIFVMFMAVFIFSCKEKVDVPEHLGTDAGMIESDTSQDALDWDGTYTATFPCADCKGIETTIELRNDNTYSIKEIYLGKSDGVIEENGKLSWDETGSKIVLENIEQPEFSRMFLVGENLLYALDKEGKMIEGKQPDDYILYKK